MHYPFGEHQKSLDFNDTPHGIFYFLIKFLELFQKTPLSPNPHFIIIFGLTILDYGKMYMHLIYFLISGLHWRLLSGRKISFHRSPSHIADYISGTFLTLTIPPQALFHSYTMPPVGTKKCECKHKT